MTLSQILKELARIRKKERRCGLVLRKNKKRRKLKV
jgi:CRISPR/Cas system CMR-associated protein Cmr3 (group 5 of RAMP superfamily)